ncbi:MAG: hypothetical protein CVT71_01080 [Alphaproteobacteria bacterium HGW-Alphaproteobacteria-10]|nr:MAG: hypothetical protein CVT71_01080 [Alphaproteobacteria bacterium HGW-Alphaproteobacteria-10]
MVIGDQIPQRPGDEKFQLPALFPTQHRSLSSIDTQSESEAWGFFNSPRGKEFSPSSFPNDEWTVARRYMGLESLARITDTPNHRLPAVAA